MAYLACNNFKSLPYKLMCLRLNNVRLRVTLSTPLRLRPLRDPRGRTRDILHGFSSSNHLTGLLGEAVELPEI